MMDEIGHLALSLSRRRQCDKTLRQNAIHCCTALGEIATARDVVYQPPYIELILLTLFCLLRYNSFDLQCKHNIMFNILM